jgi:hypothetical protein
MVVGFTTTCAISSYHHYATLNNISVILVEETGVTGENHIPVASY